MSSIVAPQVTDAVTQTNLQVVADAPAMAMGSLYQTAGHSTGLMYENSVNAQNQLNILAQAATTQGLTQLYSMDTISDSINVAKMLNASVNSIR